MTKTYLAYSLALALASRALAQSLQAPDVLVAQAIATSPAVAARVLQVQEAEEAAKAHASPKNPELELAPGVGFTNSNFVLGQSLDLFGTRAARALRARAEVAVARANLRRSQLSAGAEVLEAYASYRAALANEVDSVSGVEIARATLDAIRKRIEIGEAPALQATRAEVELNRAELALVLARSELAASRGKVNTLIGKPAQADLSVEAWLAVPALEGLAQNATSRRPEALEALARIEVARAAELEARRLGSPSFFAGIGADIWSLDRRPFDGGSIGLQVRLSMPLFDRGENRFASRAAESARKAREAELKEAERRIGLELETAATQLMAARTIAKSYETGILPKAEQMVKALQAGLRAGLTTFLEVLEAQRTLAQLRHEASDAIKNLHLAEVRILTAAANLPGLETPNP